MQKVASLTSGLIAKKGEAAPAALPSQRNTPVQQEKVRNSTSTEYYKALTFKLDKARYLALKSAGLQLDMSSQDMLTAALDAYLAGLDVRAKP